MAQPVYALCFLFSAVSFVLLGENFPAGPPAVNKTANRVTSALILRLFHSASSICQSALKSNILLVVVPACAKAGI